MSAPNAETSPPAAPAKVKLTAADVRALLRVRYAAPEWAILFEVFDSTGHAKGRSADAVAMCLWPSRGLELHGFEIKVSRGDWLREKKAPEKAEAIARFCDRWWIVAAPGVILDGELPFGWGLLVAKGGKLFVERDAPTLTPLPISRAFMACLMRRAHETTATPEDVKAEIERQVDAARKAERTTATLWRERDQQELADMRKAVRDFEAASGIHVGSYNGGQVGEAVRLVLSGGLAGVLPVVERVRGQLQHAVERLDAAIAQAPGAAAGAGIAVDVSALSPAQVAEVVAVVERLRATPAPEAT